MAHSIHNPAGKNQWSTSVPDPPEDELADFLRELAQENDGYGLPIKKQPGRIAKRFNGWTVGRTKLFDLRAKYDIGTSRKTNLTSPQKIQNYLTVKEQDPDYSWAPQTTLGAMAGLGMPPMKRDEIRLLDKAFGGGETTARNRDPLSKKFARPERGILTAAGPNDEWNNDGYEKMGAKGLKTDCGLDIYGTTDKFTTVFIKRKCVPNVRNRVTVGHLFLDNALERGGIAIQNTTDKGTEVTIMQDFQRRLRREYAPQLDEDVLPSAPTVQSKTNIVAEGGWSRDRKHYAKTLKNKLLEGTHRLVPGSILHKFLFWFVWVPVVTRILDNYVNYHNYRHKIRAQPRKYLPSGQTPIHFYTSPEDSNVPGAMECLIPVPAARIHELREEIGGMEGRRIAYSHTSVNFHKIATQVSDSLGLPLATQDTAWEHFDAILPMLQLMPQCLDPDQVSPAQELYDRHAAQQEEEESDNN